MEKLNFEQMEIINGGYAEGPGINCMLLDRISDDYWQVSTWLCSNGSVNTNFSYKGEDGVWHILFSA